MRSLRARLLAASGLAVAAILAASGVALYGLIRTTLVRQFDRALVSRARAWAALVELDEGRLELEPVLLERATAQRFGLPQYFELRDGAGRVLVRSAALGGASLIEPAPSPPGSQVRPLRLPDGPPARVAVMTFEPRREDGADAGDSGESVPRLVLAVARPTAELDRTLAACRTLMLAVGFVTLAACGLALLWIVGRELSPLRQLTRRVAELRPDRLDERLPAGPWPAELEPLVARLNEWLGRLDEAFERERTLSANVAHELRTPLSGLAATIDVALSQPRTAGAYARTLRECREICTRTQQLVENLLMLFRLERGRVPLRCEPIDLVAELRRLWRPFAETAERRRVRLNWHTPPAALIETDPTLLALLLRNLLDNAVCHVDAGGMIDIELRRMPEATELVIANTGCTLSEQDIGRVFDRFWRADPARGATGRHCGLGLSLCREIMAFLRGSIRVGRTRAGRFVVTVRW